MDTILRSIAVAHITNAYIKCYVGELSALCGCALTAGIATAVAIVYQKFGIDMKRITLAANTVIGDLGGMICDGAKLGCSMKAVSSVCAALTAAFMAYDSFGLTFENGILGTDVDKSIKNLGRITYEGMSEVDPTVIKIIDEKAHKI